MLTSRLPSLALLLLLSISLPALAQDTTLPTSVDPELSGIGESRVPKEYTVRSVRVTGVQFLDTAIITSIAAIQVGDKINIPGSDAFSKAITQLWKQKLFSNIAINILSVDGDLIDLEIAVTERPKLGNIVFSGVKKGEQEELLTKTALVKSTIITENTRRNAVDAIRKFYTDKGFSGVNVRIEEKPDPTFVNANELRFVIDKGPKVRINNVGFYGNEAVSDLRLKKLLKGTKERSRFTLHPDRQASPYGENPRMHAGEYFRSLGFLKPSTTRNFLDPFFRFKLFSSAKFIQSKFEEDKEKIIEHYNTLGYRDAQIVADTQYTAKGGLNIDLKVAEGRRYYFGNLTFKGNTKYADSILNQVLRIQKGDIYNLELLNSRTGKQVSAEGGDIGGLYQDDGYLFFRIDPVETSIYNDTIDHEIRLVEGPQATIKNVNIFGNEKTKDYVIRRELRTVPGDKFSRTDLIRSQRELGQLNYFNQEKIAPGIEPNANDGTVDINWNLEEKSSDQLELSAGWGGGIGLTGTLGVSFNNFSVKNIFKKSAWDPLPTGDGQKLSLRIQSSGKQFRSYNFSFTEPWLGGKKRNSLTLSLFNSNTKTSGEFKGNRFVVSDSAGINILGASIGLGKQLKWPDDFFSLVYSLNYTRYELKNYGFSSFGFTNGTSNNVSVRLALQRSSVFDPTFPRSGSDMSLSVQFTPPYSLIRGGTPKATDIVKNPEFHKWRFNSVWYIPIGKALGADKNRQFVLKLAAKFGFMGRYNKKLDFSPFERFQVGGDGLNQQGNGIFGFDIISLRGYNVFENSDPSNNPDINNVNRYFTLFNKYQLELRYPLVTNPGSTIYGLAFFDAANGWYKFEDYNPFRLRRSVGAGMRFFLPMFGLLGFDYGVGLDRFNAANRGLKGTARFTFMLGFEPE